MGIGVLVLVSFPFSRCHAGMWYRQWSSPSRCVHRNPSKAAPRRAPRTAWQASHKHGSCRCPNCVMLTFCRLPGSGFPVSSATLPASSFPRRFFQHPSWPLPMDCGPVPVLDNPGDFSANQWTATPPSPTSPILTFHREITLPHVPPPHFKSYKLWVSHSNWGEAVKHQTLLIATGHFPGLSPGESRATDQKSHIPTPHPCSWTSPCPNPSR